MLGVGIYLPGDPLCAVGSLTVGAVLLASEASPRKDPQGVSIHEKVFGALRRLLPPRLSPRLRSDTGPAPRTASRRGVSGVRGHRHRLVRRAEQPAARR